MAHATSPSVRLALPRLTRRPGLPYNLPLPCTNRGTVAQHGLARLCMDGATVDTRPRPALLPSRTTTDLANLPAKHSTQSLPRRQHLLVSPIANQAEQATRANSFPHPSFG